MKTYILVLMLLVMTNPIIVNADEVHKNIKHKLTGVGSWYGGKFNGRKTASGEIFNQRKLTAAHRTIPLGTKVKVLNIKNNKSVIVTITDRGPFIKHRVMDLSKHAADVIELSGIAPVKLTIIN